MLLDTEMISIMPRLMMVGDLLRGNLVVVPLPIEAPPRRAGLIYPRDRLPSPACVAFADCLRLTLSEIAASGITAITEALYQQQQKQ
jgi:LysR family pca operon transcriptional activator